VRACPLGALAKRRGPARPGFGPPPSRRGTKAQRRERRR
jgi:hypothetical protein